MFAALRVDVGVGGGGVDAADAGAPVERRIAREAARGDASVEDGCVEQRGRPTAKVLPVCTLLGRSYVLFNPFLQSWVAHDPSEIAGDIDDSE